MKCSLTTARYSRCVFCNQSDGNDDLVVDRYIVSPLFLGNEIEVEEKRKCDICQNIYKVKMIYAFKYEVVD